MTIEKVVQQVATVNMFKRNRKGALVTGTFIGRPFFLSYDKAQILVADAWKHAAKGIPQDCLLLAYYDNETSINEAILLRVLGPAKLPTDNDIISSMVEYYKDNLRTSGQNNQLDAFTQYEFSFSGLECRALGTFNQTSHDQLRFGADVENFYSAHNYKIYKPSANVLELIVNFRGAKNLSPQNDVRIGNIRYSSSQRYHTQETIVPISICPSDFLGKRTALFGMTRTGKSNTIKKIIQATVSMSDKAQSDLATIFHEAESRLTESYTKDGSPTFPVGQIIFDINGEYANSNLQDDGAAIYTLYANRTTRYSVLPKPNFKVMKVNFYRDIYSGFELIRSHLATDSADYVRSFLAIDLRKPSKEDYLEEEWTAIITRYQRKVAAYLCCLYRAGLKVPPNFRVKFSGNKSLNKLVKSDESVDPSVGLSLSEASNWFSTIWSHYETDFFQTYQQNKGYEWADEDLKAILIFLTRKARPNGSVANSGYLKLRALANLHTDTISKPFDLNIVDELRKGRIIIVDLSQGDPDVQRLYSERICRRIFRDSMLRFINNQPNNFIQFYFEEAHNLFPKQQEKDLTQIYNRIAKEGAKLSLGLAYATQEVSTIGTNILKNTQNWFIAHLNNSDELREIEKYYDFGDFVASLIRFSADTDKGFVYVKTYSNPFVIPIQIDRFAAENKEK